ncbi:MAG TPA: hypothetical protein VIM19_00625 [Actinomycetes bacterium]
MSQCDDFAADFERHAASAYNAFYDRPAMLSLLGDVTASASLMPAAARACTPLSW